MQEERIGTRGSEVRLRKNGRIWTRKYPEQSVRVEPSAEMGCSQHSAPGVCKLQHKGQMHPLPSSVNQVLLEPSYTHLVTHGLWLFSCHDRIEQLQQAPNPTIFTLCPFTEKCCQACSKKSSCCSEVLKPRACYHCTFPGFTSDLLDEKSVCNKPFR